jgi:hypothetical protein
MMRKRSTARPRPPADLERAAAEAWQAAHKTGFQDKALSELYHKAQDAKWKWVSDKQRQLREEGLVYPRVKEFKDRPKEERDNALDLAELLMQTGCTCVLRGIEREIAYHRRYMSEEDVMKMLQARYDEGIKQHVISHVRDLALKDGMDFSGAWDFAYAHVENLIANGILHQFSYYVVDGRE